ncbi:MAG: response regulator [Methylococcaceae bacterium]|jgi:two-component system invasion response regulator UvrY
MINVLLVDDHELVRTGIEALLNAISDIHVVGMANSGEEAIEMLVELSPDVVLMDINMPGMGGMQACMKILEHNPDMKIIALSVCNDGPLPHQLLKLGVWGFISKGSPLDEMVYAIRAVMEGRRYLCAEVVNNLKFQGLNGGAESPFCKLSQRETEVVSLILQGKSISEMSSILSISDKTINTYRYRLYEKLQIKNDVELTRLAIKFSYIDSALI